MPNNFDCHEEMPQNKLVPNLLIRDFVWLIVVVALYFVLTPLINETLVGNLAILFVVLLACLGGSFFFIRHTSLFSFFFIVAIIIFAFLIQLLLAAWVSLEGDYTALMELGFPTQNNGSIFTILPLVILVVLRAKKVIGSFPAFCFLACCWVIHLMWVILIWVAYMMAGPS